MSLIFVVVALCFTSFVLSETIVQKQVGVVTPDEVGDYQRDTEIICLYDEWEFPVERIDSRDKLEDLVPHRNNQNRQSGAENNILLALHESSCEKDAHHTFFIGAHYQTGPGSIHMAVFNKDLYPEIVQLWNLPKNCSSFIWIPRGSFFEDYANFPSLPDQSDVSFSEFLKSNRRAHAPFINNFGAPIKFYWFEKSRKYLATLQPGDRRNENTFLGHVFLAYTEDDKLIDFYVVTGNVEVSIEMPEYCKINNWDFDTCSQKTTEDMDSWVFEFWARKREALNFVQPRVVRNFTAIGFKKTKLPDEIFEPIKNYWNKRFNADDLQEENHAGPVLNQYKSPTYMAHLKQKERKLLENYFRNALEEWSNTKDLQMTSLYGIRKYTRGAILGLHVDTCSTHVISAIINVDSKLDEGKDWPLQIYDHDHNLYEFNMKPGEVVFYESARNGHSRRKPLLGEYYANIFIHFRPGDRVFWNYDWF